VTLARPPSTPELHPSPLRVDITQQIRREGLNRTSPPEPFTGVSGSSPMNSQQDAGPHQAVRLTHPKAQLDQRRSEACRGSPESRHATTRTAP
jgi:hypothetical protein